MPSVYLDSGMMDAVTDRRERMKREREGDPDAQHIPLRQALYEMMDEKSQNEIDRNRGVADE